MSENQYDLYIILNGSPCKVLIENNASATEEEAIDFVTKMRSATFVDYISTDQGILSYDVKNITSVFYIAKPTN